MIINSESDMLKFGEKFAKSLNFPCVIELIGDVGVGKTTFTRGLAKGLGVNEEVTSPSFTISKRYALSDNNHEIVHYDFYRLNDPGIMQDEIADTIANKNAITVIEWAGDVANILPEDRISIKISLQEDGSREVIVEGRE